MSLFLAAIALAQVSEPPPAQNVRVLKASDGAAEIRIWSEPGSRGEEISYFSMSLDGQSFTPAEEADNRLLLRYREFDPRLEIPSIPEELRAGPENRLFIVQGWSSGPDAFWKTVRDQGAKTLLFLANYAYVAEIDPQRLEAVRALPFVRAVIPFHPAYRLEEPLLARIAAVSQETIRVNVLVAERGLQTTVAAWAEANGAVVEEVSERSYLMSLTLPVSLLPGLAARNEVQWIDRWSAPENDMNIARDFHGAKYVESVLGIGYRGAGVRGEVLDDGCETNHPDLQNFLVHSPTNTASSHGVCTSGIVFGSGVGKPAARGVLSDGTLIIGDYNFYAGGSRYNHTAQLVNPSLAYQCVFQSNSWGSSLTTQYTSTSQNMDTILFDLQKLSICQSQSNNGNQFSRPEAWAKNVISVGGINHKNTLTAADDSWGGASIGPAADGRIKPDLASFYDSVLCTDRVGSAGYSGTNYYSNFGGTSAATPIVAGHLGLFYQMWHNQIFGNAAPGATVFENAPYNTTAKAMLINTATQWSFSGTAHNLTRTHQGWGHPDLQRMLDQSASLFFVDESVVLTELQVTSYSFVLPAGKPEFRVTMVYRDPPGTTSSTLHRINNLDLQVVDPNGLRYYGNNGLTAGMFSTAGGSPNNKDTVENVFVQNPIPGTWTVNVRAADLNQDSHVETPGMDADFALVVSGF